MATLNDYSILIHPGLNGSGPDHWHTRWERAFPEFQRVQQADWDHPGRMNGVSHHGVRPGDAARRVYRGGCSALY